MLRLSAEWTKLLDTYEELHSDPRNQFCHDVSIPLIITSFPLAVFGAGLAVAMVMVVLGGFFVALGHRFEGHAPDLIDDPRQLAVAVIWWLERRGIEFDKPIKSTVESRK